MSLTLIIARVQTAFEAQGATWCDKDYIVSWLSIHNEDVELELASLGLSYEEQDIILPNVPANTFNLDTYMATGQQLASMMLPYSLEWRYPQNPLPNQPQPSPPPSDAEWKMIERLDKKIDIIPNDPDQNIEGIQSWSWKGGKIWTTPSSIAVDIRVGCQNLPDVFQSDSDNYIKGITNWLVYGTAELIAFSRGGGASKLGVVFQARKNKVADSIESLMIQDEQLVRRRLAGRRSRGRGGFLRLPRE